MTSIYPKYLCKIEPEYHPIQFKQLFWVSIDPLGSYESEFTAETDGLLNVFVQFDGSDESTLEVYVNNTRVATDSSRIRFCAASYYGVKKGDTIKVRVENQSTEYSYNYRAIAVISRYGIAKMRSLVLAQSSNTYVIRPFRKLERGQIIVFWGEETTDVTSKFYLNDGYFYNTEYTDTSYNFSRFWKSPIIAGADAEIKIVFTNNATTGSTIVCALANWGGYII